MVVGDTAGRLHAFDITTGEEQDCLALGSSISADAVVYNNTILIVTRDGVLHKIRVDANGELVPVAQQQVLGSCMAAPDCCWIYGSSLWYSCWQFKCNGARTR